MIESSESGREVSFRPAEPRDDARVAEIIRAIRDDLGCGGDSNWDVTGITRMSAAFASDHAGFYVVDHQGTVRGCGGFQPVPSAAGAGELQKMYFLPELRGHGHGRRFLRFLLDRMRAAGFFRVYLETTATMKVAGHLYRSEGFHELDAPMGDPGKSPCEMRFLLDL